MPSACRCARFFAPLLLGIYTSFATAAPDTTPANDPTALYTNRTFHFSLEVPHLANTKRGPQIFRSPEENGAASSIIIILQPQHTTRADYLAAGLSQLKHDGCAIKQSTPLTVSGHDAVLLEYTQPPTQQHPLHLIVLAVITPDLVYNITAAATLDNFPAHEAEFRKSLDSFTLLNAAAANTQPAATGSSYINREDNYAITLPAFDLPFKSTIPALFRSTEGDGEITSLAITVNALKITREKSVDQMTALLALSKDPLYSRTDFQLSGHDATILDWEQTSATGKRTHFFALKIFMTDTVFSALWSTTPTHFKEHQQEFLQSLKSFRFDLK